MKNLKFRIWDGNTIRLLEGYASFEQGMFTMSDFTPSAIMQYTGLKDKNGKEIFEGDILKENLYRKKEPVEYDEKVGGYFSIINRVTNGHELEVIGNVWENGELLK